VRYRADRPLAELIDTLQKDLQTIDNDVKAKFQQYNQVKANLLALQRRQTYGLASQDEVYMTCADILR
jgi:V-type H+-transporting ATPase subunit C